MHAQLLDVVRNKLAARNDKAWALVIGDLMLDRYLIGEVERISPEAPVPIVLLKQHYDRVGGAANVAANLARLGVVTRIAGCTGNDTDGKTLSDMLSAIGIAPSGILQSAHRPTTTKTRILGGHQQMMRLDQESRAPISAEETQQLFDLVLQQIEQQPAVVILSDYAKGVLSTTLCEKVIARCRQLKIKVLVDPKGLDFSKYRGATALTPNKRETAEACKVDPKDNQALLAAATALQQSLELEFLAMTRGEEGISIIDATHTQHISATAKQVFDVSGAGDTVIATLAAGMIAGLTHTEALQLANIAAGIVVGKVGTVPITREELLHELIAQGSTAQVNKIHDLDSLKAQADAWRASGQKIVFTNGCFDLLHAGHVTYLEAARKMGDRLVLGLNTDASVRTLKGPTRPVIHEADRARVLAGLEAIDAVILFGEDTPLNLINAVRPDILVKGSDYTEDQVVGGKEVKSWGGRVALVDVVPGRSTSNIIDKLAH
ncbi:MAG TPA: D-glycero-beta-D-manno-heptose-7-phosphate kinase [Oxalicibacterium sp.]|uniref:D-glycero-beta-D-manno-heptose-7-phosphate kinase n=1 Tax=Oxalicibacterium sp. TaxID=2766525 RepID=UPI002CB2C487|nr:D-glycero-beta-D-manno-heptose-7-phosphate kinase [Oxalicibacterium sp.]HWU97633.1 D-glycero-beta-D-manno-heptose-7-phosphate kinase [Oxalicibacterium sp.]